MKIGIQSLPALLSAIKGSVWGLHRVQQTGEHVAASLEERKDLPLSHNRGNLVNKGVSRLQIKTFQHLRLIVGFEVICYFSYITSLI